MHGSPYGADMAPRFPRGCWGSPTFSSPLGTDDRAFDYHCPAQKHTHIHCWKCNHCRIHSFDLSIIEFTFNTAPRKEDPMRTKTCACLLTLMVTLIMNFEKKSRKEILTDADFLFRSPLSGFKDETFFTKRKHNWLLGNFHLFCTEDWSCSLASHT